MRLASSVMLLVLTASASLVAVPSALALDSLDDVRCVCADGALGLGDHVSCVAKLSRRLVAAGAIDQATRSDAIAAASEADLDALAAECPPAFAPGGGETGWGTSVSVSTPRPDVSPAFITLIDVQTKLWNRAGCVICPDVQLELPVQPDGSTCLFEARVLRDDLVVRRELHECDPAGPTVLEIPRGTTITRDFGLPLLALDADPATGLPDGALLSGVLEVEVRWTGDGPEFDGGAAGGGRQPLARIPIRTR